MILWIKKPPGTYPMLIFESSFPSELVYDI